MRGWADPRLCAILLSFAASTAAQAGAFLQPPGEGVAILSTSFAEAHKAYDSLGRIVSAPSYHKLEAQLYVEYGLTEELTLVAESSYMRFRGSGALAPLEQLAILTEQARSGAALYLPPGVGAGARYAGLGAGWLGGRMKLLGIGSVILSAQGSLRAATDPGRRFLDMRDHVQGDGRLQLGWPVELLGFAGFGEAQLGFRSSGQNGDEIRGEITTGLRPIGDVLLLAQGFFTFTPWASGGAFTASHRLQLSAVYDLAREVAVQIGARAAIRGVNDSAERGLVGALWYRF
jgi:hypothetical protein